MINQGGADCLEEGHSNAVYLDDCLQLDQVYAPGFSIEFFDVLSLESVSFSNIQIQKTDDQETSFENGVESEVPPGYYSVDLSKLQGTGFKPLTSGIPIFVYGTESEKIQKSIPGSSQSVPMVILLDWSSEFELDLDITVVYFKPGDSESVETFGIVSSLKAEGEGLRLTNDKGIGAQASRPESMTITQFLQDYFYLIYVSPAGEYSSDDGSWNPSSTDMSHAEIVLQVYIENELVSVVYPPLEYSTENMQQTWVIGCLDGSEGATSLSILSSVEAAAPSLCMVF